MLRSKTPLRRGSPLRRTAFKTKKASVIRRTPMKKKRKPVSFHHGSAAGLEHMAHVKEVGCVICHRYAEAHHPLSMRRGTRASDYDCIALCFNHHSALTPLPHGEAIHKGTETFCATYGSEAQLLEKTRAKLRARGYDDGAEASARE